MKKYLLLVLIPCLLWVMVRSDVSVGRVLDNAGNGKEYNGEPYYNYIHYDESVYSENDIVLSVFILNPFNNYLDDIIYRKDFLLFKNTKECGVI